MAWLAESFRSCSRQSDGNSQSDRIAKQARGGAQQKPGCRVARKRMWQVQKRTGEERKQGAHRCGPPSAADLGVGVGGSSSRGAKDGGLRFEMASDLRVGLLQILGTSVNPAAIPKRLVVQPWPVSQSLRQTRHTLRRVPDGKEAGVVVQGILVVIGLLGWLWPSRGVGANEFFQTDRTLYSESDGSQSGVGVRDAERSKGRVAILQTKRHTEHQSKD